MLYKGLWQCISADETYIEPRKMHHLVWEQLAEAMEISTREVAESVSNRFESQRVKEKVAEQSINKMIFLFIPSSRVLHAREIFAGNNNKVALSLNQYNVVQKDRPLLVMNDTSSLISDHDAFAMTGLATNTRGGTTNYASREFVVCLTDEFEAAAPRPFDRTRLVTIFKIFMQEKYSTIIEKK